MKVIKKFLLSKEKLVLDWAYTNRLRIFRFFVIAFSLKLISSTPYLNLIISSTLVNYFIFIFGLIIFNINFRNLTIFSFILFVFAAGSLLVGGIESAEAVGDFVYLILIFIAVKLTINET